jgi:hypothetical protein
MLLPPWHVDGNQMLQLQQQMLQYRLPECQWLNE